MKKRICNQGFYTFYIQEQIQNFRWGNKENKRLSKGRARKFLVVEYVKNQGFIQTKFVIPTFRGCTPGMPLTIMKEKQLAFMSIVYHSFYNTFNHCFIFSCFCTIAEKLWLYDPYNGITLLLLSSIGTTYLFNNLIISI